jgi:hypothetical protein
MGYLYTVYDPARSIWAIYDNRRPAKPVSAEVTLPLAIALMERWWCP